MLIIDCHCHAGTGDGLTGPWDTRAPLEDYLRRAREAGIDRTNLLAAFSSDYADANAEVARIVATEPQRFHAFAFVHAVQDRGRVLERVRTLVEQHGFAGIKVHRHDAPLSREICAAARALSLPVLYDVMGEVWICELLAQEYPDVDFIIPHLGSFADDWRAQLSLIDHLVRHPNIYTDTAGVRRFDLLEQAITRAGARKILFGTDGPWLHPGVEIEKVYALGLSPADERLVLGENFLRLIDRSARASVQRSRTRSCRTGVDIDTLERAPHPVLPPRPQGKERDWLTRMSRQHLPRMSGMRSFPCPAGEGQDGGRNLFPDRPSIGLLREIS